MALMSLCQSVDINQVQSSRRLSNLALIQWMGRKDNIFTSFFSAAQQQSYQYGRQRFASGSVRFGKRGVLIHSIPGRIASDKRSIQHAPYDRLVNGKEFSHFMTEEDVLQQQLVLVALLAGVQSARFISSLRPSFLQKMTAFVGQRYATVQLITLTRAHQSPAPDHKVLVLPVPPEQPKNTYQHSSSKDQRRGMATCIPERVRPYMQAGQSTRELFATYLHSSVWRIVQCQ